MPEEARTVTKEVPNAVLYSDGTILLKNVRCSYPSLFKPKPNTDKTGAVTGYSYTVTGLMPKDSHDAANKLIRSFMKAMLADKNKGLGIPAKDKFYKNGDPTDEDDPGKPENLGMWIVSTRETKKPVLLSNKKDPKTGKARRLGDADMEMIYGGCYVNMLIRPWWQNDPTYGKRINCGISVVQFVRNGEPFGAGRITDEIIDNAFEAEDGEETVSDDEDADDADGL